MTPFRLPAVLAGFATMIAAVAAQPAHGSGGGGGGGGGGAQPVAVEPVAVPIVDAGRVVGRLDVTFMVMPGAVGPAELTRRMPVLRAAAVAALIDEASMEVSPRAPIDAARLAERLEHALHAAEPSAHAVLLIEVSARPA